MILLHKKRKKKVLFIIKAPFKMKKLFNRLLLNKNEENIYFIKIQNFMHEYLKEIFPFSL
jgi:hypothetical protein